MNSPSGEDIQYLVLVGALCVGGAVVGAIFGMCHWQGSWPIFFALSAVAFGLLAACTTVGLYWIQWGNYDKGIRASMESATTQGYDVHRSIKSDGTVVYKIKNYIIQDGSFVIVANRSPFRLEWSFLVKWSLFCGIVAALVSLISRRIARSCVSSPSATT